LTKHRFVMQSRNLCTKPRPGGRLEYNEPFDTRAFWKGGCGPMTQIDWLLHVHGDSRERKWSERVTRDFPSYEELWRKHVVPLTFRVVEQSELKLIRPTLPQYYVDLADANYATLYHLTSCYEWQTRLADYPSTESILPIESFYCFLAHAISCADSVLWLADSVNRVLIANERSIAFDLEPARDHKKRLLGYPAYLKGCINGPDIRQFRDLTKDLRNYRNAVIHRRPLFMLSKSVPVRSKLPEYSGLAAISRLALRPDHIRVYFSDAEALLDKYSKALGEALNPLWKFAIQHLDSLPPEHLQARAIPDPKDLLLKREHVDKAIAVSRGLGAQRPT
jgi:hypothetical protein